MAKVPSVPGLEQWNASQRLRGVLSFHYNTKFQTWVVRRWPGKRPGGTPKQLAARAAFAAAAALIKQKSSDDYQAALGWSVGTGFTWKDLMTMAAYGTLLESSADSGITYRSYALMTDEVQSLLDSITNEPGAMLVRTTDGWRGLAPGIADEVLTWDGPTSLPDWKPIHVESGFDPWAVDALINTPVASQWTLVQNSGGTASIADLGSGRGVRLNVPSSGVSSMAIAEESVTSQSAFVAQGWFHIPAPYANSAWACGIGVVDSAGKVQLFGARNVGAGLAEKADFRFTAIGTFSTSVVDGTFEWPMTSPVWFQLQLTGGNFVLRVSLDGENFLQLASLSKTTFLGATLSHIGPMFYLNQSGQSFGPNIYSWDNV